jgi:hypothetical protein
MTFFLMEVASKHMEWTGRYYIKVILKKYVDVNWMLLPLDRMQWVS